MEWRSHSYQRHMLEYYGNNFGFCFLGAPSPATLKVCPNSNSWLCKLSVHMIHSWLNVHPEPTRWWFHQAFPSGMLAGGVWGFLSFIFIKFIDCISIIPHLRLRQTPPKISVCLTKHQAERGPSKSQWTCQNERQLTCLHKNGRAWRDDRQQTCPHKSRWTCQTRGDKRSYGRIDIRGDTGDWALGTSKATWLVSRDLAGIVTLTRPTEDD